MGKALVDVAAHVVEDTDKTVEFYTYHLFMPVEDGWVNNNNKSQQPPLLHENVYDFLKKITTLSGITEPSELMWYNQKEDGDQRGMVYQYLVRRYKVDLQFNTKPPAAIPAIPTIHQIRKGEEYYLQVQLPRYPEKPSPARLQELKEKGVRVNPKRYQSRAAARRNYFMMLEKAGLEVKTLNWIEGHTPICFSGNETDNVSMVKTSFLTAHVVVSDPQKFAYAIKNGIGRLKTYGFGRICYEKIH